MIRNSTYLSCILAVGIASGQEVSAPRNTIDVPASVMAARLLTTVQPKPPQKPMRKCSNAMVTLDAVIDETGKVSSVKVLSGFSEFRESASSAVKQWTYKPYQMDGAAVSVETTVLVFYPSQGNPGPLLVPDNRGGVKGGKFLPMPQGCGPPIAIKPAPVQ